MSHTPQTNISSAPSTSLAGVLQVHSCLKLNAQVEINLSCIVHTASLSYWKTFNDFIDVFCLSALHLFILEEKITVSM